MRLTGANNQQHRAAIYRDSAIALQGLIADPATLPHIRSAARQALNRLLPFADGEVHDDGPRADAERPREVRTTT